MLHVPHPLWGGAALNCLVAESQTDKFIPTGVANHSGLRPKPDETLILARSTIL
jgi:hypothetical protein